LLYSAAVSALPAAAPAKFALQITATMGGTPTTLYLPKGGSANGVTDAKDAAACSIDEKTQLICDGKPQGVAPRAGGTLDMAGITPATANAITTGFSVDSNNVIHWKNKELEQKLPAFAKAVTEDGQYKNGEAKFGLFKSMLTGGKTQLYFQLGCPGTKGMENMGGTHGGAHEPVVEGVAKAIAL
jgi:hypothetical protein